MRMNDTMVHRGPDDAGAELYEAADGYTVGFAQRRLSIQDLSPLGHQPMHSKDGRISVVYNGEIYNFLDLKKELNGYDFVSSCDTEVIIAAYLKWGKACVHRFNGMFAISLYDRETQEVIFMVDRIGVKPLYYHLTDTAEDGSCIPGRTGLVFGSELKPVMADPDFSEEIRQDVITRYLFQQYINAPDTIFRNVYKVSPGTILTFRNGALTEEKYWDVRDMYHRMQEDPVTDYDEAKAGLKKLLQEATARRMIADVPLGSFLSGGYDSSLISAIAQEHLGSTPLRTFSIGFEEKEYDEAQYAEEVARHLGTDHTSLYIGEKDMFDLVQSIPQYFDEPFADSSQIPTMLVSMLARRHVTVVLSGDAGDEFFCGYNIYDTVKQAQSLDLLGAAAHVVGQIPLGRHKLEEKYPFRVRVVAANRDKETKTQFGAGSYVEYAKKMVLPAKDMLSVNYETESRYGVDNWQIRRMLLDMDTYLPGDILVKVDRASMKYSLECRCPILDKEVMEYSYRIRHDFKYHNGSKKYILKDIAYDYIPKELLDRPKKGFGVPLGKWLQGPLKEELSAYADRDFLIRQGIFDADFVNRMIGDFLLNGDGGPATGRNFSKLSWSFFCFQAWYAKWRKEQGA